MGDLTGEADFDEAFTVLYPRARSVALRILGSVPEAEDVASEAMARALVRWRRVGGMPHRDAWVLRVTANLAIDAVRRRRSQPAAHEIHDGEEDASVLRLALVTALRALPRRQREAIVLRHLAGLPEREVAASLGVSSNTVKKHLQRGLGTLRTHITREEEDLLDIG